LGLAVAEYVLVTEMRGTSRPRILQISAGLAVLGTGPAVRDAG
jgi:hypothetical protein